MGWVLSHSDPLGSLYAAAPREGVVTLFFQARDLSILETLEVGPAEFETLEAILARYR